MFFKMILSCLCALASFNSTNVYQSINYSNDTNAVMALETTPIKNYSMDISSVSTLDNGVEYLSQNVGKYSGLVNSTLRINWKMNSGKYKPSISINNYYAKIIDYDYAVVDDEMTGYYDLELLGEGETMLMISALDSNGNTISFDNLNLKIYKEIESIKLTTVTNSYYLNKNLQIKVTINDDDLLFASDLHLYYNNGNEKVLIINALDENNYFNVTIDSELNKLDEISFIAETNTVQSETINFARKEVNFISYCDIVDTNQLYVLTDSVVSFYVRIPLNSNPEFILNNKSNSIELIKYQLSENFDTYSVVEFKIKLLKSTIDDEVIIGSLTYDANGVNNRGYNYKNFRLSILDKVTSLDIKSLDEDDVINYGEIVNFNTIINDYENVDCKVQWFLDDNLIQEGGQLKCQFYESGNHVLKIKYGEFEATKNLLVGYSTQETIIWIAIFFVTLIVICTVMISLSKVKKKQTQLLLPYIKPMNKFDSMFKAFVENPNANAIDGMVKVLKNFIVQLGIYDISDESVSFDVIVDNCRKLLQGLQNYKTANEDKKEFIVHSLELKWETIFRAIQDFNAIIMRKEGA